jgi:hypothetical protein
MTITTTALEPNVDVPKYVREIADLHLVDADEAKGANLGGSDDEFVASAERRLVLEASRRHPRIDRKDPACV